MSSPFDDVCRARIPREAIARLAGLRVEPGLRVALTADHAWLRWDAGNERVLQAVMPIHGVVLYSFEAGRWYRFGSSLPDFDFPTDLDEQPLAHVMFPAVVQPIAAPTFAGQPLRLTLERDDRPRATSAVLCPLASLSPWCDTVPTARLAALVGVWLGEEVLLLGDHLPLLQDGDRFWGRDVLAPLGLAPAPALPESAIKEAAGLHADELLLWQPDRAEGIARTLLSPLTRAGVRLAVRGTRP
jgi:MoxR-vWA-beta-propeller ternary system domain bpX2